MNENAEQGFSVITLKTTVRSSGDRSMPVSALTALGAQAREVRAFCLRGDFLHCHTHAVFVPKSSRRAP